VERPRDVKPTQREPKTLGNDCVDSRGSAIKFAAQRSLRLDLTQAGVASALFAQLGASRTQAPSRPRRLRNISAEFFRPAVDGNLKEVRSR